MLDGSPRLSLAPRSRVVPVGIYVIGPSSCCGYRDGKHPRRGDYGERSLLGTAAAAHTSLVVCRIHCVSLGIQSTNRISADWWVCISLRDARSAYLHVLSKFASPKRAVVSSHLVDQADEALAPDTIPPRPAGPPSVVIIPLKPTPDDHRRPDRELPWGNTTRHGGNRDQDRCFMMTSVHSPVLRRHACMPASLSAQHRLTNAVLSTLIRPLPANFKAMRNANAALEHA